MDVNSVSQMIATLGFPIVCVIAMGWFIYKVYMDGQERSARTMTEVQARNNEREEKLYAEIKENREVNAKAIATIAHYAEKLDTIQHDISDIKSDITVIKAKEV